MKTPLLLAVTAALGLCQAAQAQALLIPEDRTIPPLAMLRHRVETTIEDQVAVTRIEQTFRNHTARPLEAVYLFPVPRGAGVREFAMWVDGKRVKGELVEAAKAKQIYTDIVRRTLDPGLLEYMGTDLLRLNVFPVPANGDQKIEVTYTSLCRKDHELVEYLYPIRTDGKATRTLEDFSFKVTLRSKQPILTVYSPTHAVSVARLSDRHVIVGFEKNQCLLDRDFQLLYTTGTDDVAITSLAQRPTHDNGYFLFLITPRAELSKEFETPRDFVFVLDTSGSMAENGRIEQARKALNHCLGRLTPNDRFGLIQFATTVNPYATGLTQATADEVSAARKWVDKLSAVGGTAIDDALQAALDMQDKSGRVFTVVFFTDGLPTIGETAPDNILKNVARKNTRSTRIFTFGVGDTVNAAFLDRLAEQSRAASVYVRPEEDLELKVSSFFAKISQPALTDLHWSVDRGCRLSDIYPPRLPDLFHGDQLVVLGRYDGAGDTTLRLTGRLGVETREFVYHVDLPARNDDKPFVEDLWARRKVGYLLEQIRTNGEKKELVDEVVTLAKKYGIATPYTSWLVVPDTPLPIVRPPLPRPFPRPFPPPILAPRPGMEPRRLAEVADGLAGTAGGLAGGRSGFEAERYAGLPKAAKGDWGAKALLDAKEHRLTFEAARGALAKGDLSSIHTDRLGVDVSLQIAALKNLNHAQPSALRRAAGRSLVEIGGVWIDAGFEAKAKTVIVRALSDAYFRILEQRPEMKEVFQLGNHVVWITPSGAALVIDLNDGMDMISDRDIADLFRRGG